jgi:uncharacterized membrane protein YeaQ/YmgE (transglycosylase-associated protein family)
MSIVILVIFSSLIGWLASIVMRQRDKRSLTLNVLAAIAGAFLAAAVINPLMGGNVLLSSVNESALLVWFLGALGLLTIVTLMRRLTRR